MHTVFISERQLNLFSARLAAIIGMLAEYVSCADYHEIRWRYAERIPGKAQLRALTARHAAASPATHEKTHAAQGAFVYSFI